MTPSSENLARKIGLLDALIFFTVWIIIGMSSAPSFSALVLGITLLVPISALVGWRGTISVRRILFAIKKPSIAHAALEGFGWGVFAALIFWLWGHSNSVMAAGTSLDGLSPAEAQFWVATAASLAPISIIAGICGAITGIVLHLINLCLVKYLR